MDEALKLFSAFRPCLDVVANTVQDTARRWLPDLTTGEQVVIGDRQFRLLRVVRSFTWRQNPFAKVLTPPPLPDPPPTPRGDPVVGLAGLAGATQLEL